MFSIIENIYSGWQYFISFLSLSAGNFHIVLENISKMSGYIVDFFNAFSAPFWIVNTILAVLGFGVVSKLCHWR